MMHSCPERKMIIWSSCLIFSLSYSMLVFASPPKPLCRSDQRDALLEFKSEFVFQTTDRLIESDPKAEWWRNNTDCCSWAGISCDLKTGKVVELELVNSFLNGHLRSNSSLFRLQHLEILVLSNKNLSGKIPSSLGNLSFLTHLDLSDNGFTGELPDSMGNLNRLTYLRLDNNKFSGNFPFLLLNLSELTEINLISNQFKGTLPSNMSSLSKVEYFDIYENSFSGSIPSSLFVIPSLSYLSLSRNSFSGPLEIGNISSPSKLRELSLEENNFTGPIPESISKLVGLEELDLSFWHTGQGMVDFSIFSHLTSIKRLHLSYLSTRSMVDLSLFAHLKSLWDLDLSGNNLKISSALQLDSSIQLLKLSSCNIAEFPKFLQTQKNLFYLDISANQIEGQVPEWLWILPELQYVDISQNFFNDFEGPADVIQSNGQLDSITFFLASSNLFTGEIPRTICRLVHLETLVLSNNNFSGSIPRCFKNFNTTISVLHLQNNSLSGVIPEDSIGDRLRSLDVGHNRLLGELPKSLINCTQLVFLNVEDNKIKDRFPFWLRLLPILQFLVLRSNEFHGSISSPGDNLCFPNLRIFDVSKNLFTGVLPSEYFACWSAMSSPVVYFEGIVHRLMFQNYHKAVGLTNKGLNMELVGSGFTIYKTIDVSGNRLEGGIPESIGLLKELVVLNMSNNAFTGRIPTSLSNLTNLQSLDLSQNRLSGKIPPELGKLTFLSLMNFSNNKLEGPIPKGTQIQTQNSSSFAENPGLCGAPLQETCNGGGEEEAAKQEEEDEKKEEKDQVLSWVAAAIAYVPGVFCGFVISHILSSYRHDWFMRIFRSFA